MEDIPNKIINNTGVFPETNHFTMEDKDVIEIVIEPCGMPISYRGVYYYRSGATKQEFRGAALHQFLLKKMGLDWEDVPCDGITLDDIDDSAIEYFLDHAIGEGRGYEKIMKAFDKANLKRPELIVEQGGVTAVICREIFMSIRGDQQPIQNRTKTELKPN